MLNPDIIAKGFIVLILIALGILFYRVKVIHPKQREERNEKYEEEEKREVLRSLTRNVNFFLGIDLDTVHEIFSQDEIVRVVNLCAYQLAVSCVNQDIVARGGKAINLQLNSDALSGTGSRWEDKVYHLKEEWSHKRNLALQIAPELKDRLPHFSEFEPLKSYRAEHLRKKA